MKKNYKDYKNEVLECLSKALNLKKAGVWKYKNKEIEKEHILPLTGVENNSKSRAQAINDYLHFDCTSYLTNGASHLHRYAHHLNSSQLLCLMFFGKLTEKKDGVLKVTQAMADFIKNAFGIEIKVGAECQFEYTEKEAPYLFDANKDGEIIGKYEGTSFDFHINDGSVEVYFEIKFTEDGFKKEKGVDDKRHKAKATKYLEIAPQFFKEKVSTPEEFLKQYQIYRNIIRAIDSNKHVIFISDGNNPSTTRDVEEIKKHHFPDNVKFVEWQDLISCYPFELPFQLKAIQNIKEHK